MGLLSAIRAAFKAEPAHVEPRYYAATKADNTAARQRQIDRQLELAVAVSTLSPNQRARAIEAAKRGRG